MTRRIRKHFFRVFFISICTVMAMMAQGVAPISARTDPTPGGVQSAVGYGNIPLFFTPNRGQLDERVGYAIPGKDKSVYFTPEGLTFILPERGSASPMREKRNLREIEPGEIGQEARRKRWVVKLDFVGARRDVRPESLEKAETLVSYFKGRPEEWRAGLQTSAKIIYRDLWPGIDLIYYGTVNRLKYDFIVHPGADPARIKLAYRGADRVEVTGEGRIEVATPLGVFQDEIPAAWQERDGKRADVAVAYALLAEQPTVRVAGLSLIANDSTATSGIHPRHRGHVYGFTVGRYDPSRTLVPDPAMLIYCGYIGGSGSDYGYGIALDSAGNAYVTGDTDSSQATFPVMAGPDLTYNGGSTDAFVAKVNPAGAALLYCGDIGGSGNDYGYGIALDGAGSAYVTGATNSTNLPVTATWPYQTFNGLYDAFVAKIQETGDLRVFIVGPANGQWRRTGTTTWRGSGYTQTGLIPGSYTLEFSVVRGWSAKAGETVTVRAGQTFTLTAVYTRSALPGALMLLLDQ
jgi:hypothetical protein